MARESGAEGNREASELRQIDHFPSRIAQYWVTAMWKETFVRFARVLQNGHRWVWMGTFLALVLATAASK